MMRRGGDGDLFFEFNAAKRRESRERVVDAAAEFHQMVQADEIERLEELKARLDVRSRQEHAQDLRREYLANGLDPIEAPVLVSLPLMQKLGFRIPTLKRMQKAAGKRREKSLK